MTYFYTADTHFDHAKIMVHEDEQMRNYPFTSINERDEFIFKRWNEKVGNDDHVFIVGDLAFASKERTASILSYLNGTKTIIMGNHDKGWLYDFPSSYPQTRVRAVKQIMEENDRGRKVIMSHYPLFAWKFQFRGSFHVYGHVHNGVEEPIFQAAGRELAAKAFTAPEFRALNAGIALNDWAPATLDEMAERYNVTPIASFPR